MSEPINVTPEGETVVWQQPENHGRLNEALRKETTVQLLPYDTDLKRTQTDVPPKCFLIEELIGAGTTAMSYYAFDPVHQTNCILKECFPVGANLFRDDMELKLQGDATAFEAAKERFLEGYLLSRDLYYPKVNSLDYAVSGPLGFFSGNGTLYAAYMIREGISYNKRRKDGKPFDKTLSELLYIILQLAETISYCHLKGYLHLDIRDDNVFVLGCGEERGKVHGVMLFDFDSMVRQNEIREKILNRTLRFSGVNQPPELRDIIDADQIGIRTDQYQIAALLYQRLHGGRYYNGIIPTERKGLLHDCSDHLYKDITGFLKNALEDRCYQDDEPFIEALTDLFHRAFRMENPDIMQEYEIGLELLRIYSRRTCEEDAGKKFRSLAALKIYDNHIRMRLADCRDETGENEPVLYDVLKENRLLFFVGDGGIGKSTLLQTYREAKLNDGYATAEVIPFYIELHRYQDGKNHFPLGPAESSHTDWIPFHLLCRLNGTETPSEGSELYNKIQKQYHGLDALFSCSRDDGFRYTILLDGFNEVSEHKKSVLLKEIAYYANKWQSVQFIITGRKFPKECEDVDPKSEYAIYMDFSVYSVLGLHRDEIREAFKESAYPEAAAEKIMHDERLMSILHIPLFLNLFLGTDEAYTKSIRSRGEILDAFITSKTTAFYNETLAAKKAENDDEGLFRRFLLDYLLPFAASYADQKHSFMLKQTEIQDSLEMGYNVLLGNNSVDIPAASKSYKKSEICTLSRILSGDAESSGKYRSYSQLLKKSTFNDVAITYLVENAAYMVGDSQDGYEFSHQYFRDYFAAKQIVNVLKLAKTLQPIDSEGKLQLRFIHELCGLDYTWSDDVCILLGEIVGDYKNEPGYSEE